MENYSLLMGAAALRKMAVEMAAVSMEKPSGALPRPGGVPEQRLLSPRSWLRDGGGSGRKDVERTFGVLQAQFVIIRYPALSWSHDQMWEVIQACVIMHNMIIEDDRKNHVMRHVGPYECQSPLAEVDHELPADFADFLAMHVEIRDSNVHEQF
ncbi:hypothetical protein QYE76_031663 [Lolium multiflorum]|uniref:DDE Tnp4 domain-containing protein n=1 Tax=Lolium multiflorum TaxID=4521 RepID=A0AAD8QTA3_LOLMU|nr:hypothetical protein QYE76_031663 [Lolium multiflorum]